jgi:hypothetical protein
VRLLVSLCLALLWLQTASFAQAPVRIDLGPSNDVAALYSFPNNCAEVCFIEQTLSQTVGKYLRASLDRDGFGATTIAVDESAGRISVWLGGDGAADYVKLLPAYLAAGSLGLQGARELLTALGPDGHKLWRYNWRFFLPHGIAMFRHRTVQLLHFPPDNVLMDVQDYLAAATTKRWAELLVKNGAAPNEVDRFQNIIDIVPIALPDKDACYLDPHPPRCATTRPTAERSGVYPHFDNYITALLNLWVPLPRQAGSRPLVAFGGPVRDWLKAVYHVDLPRPLVLGTVNLSGMKVPTLSANHPSYIWKLKDPNTQLGAAMKVMLQDHVAACWQVKMGMDATSDPQSTLSFCTQAWSGRDKEMCELVYTEVFHKTPDCANIGPDVIRSVSDAELGALPDND